MCGNTRIYEKRHVYVKSDLQKRRICGGRARRYQKCVKTHVYIRKETYICETVRTYTKRDVRRRKEERDAQKRRIYGKITHKSVSFVEKLTDLIDFKKDMCTREETYK